MITISDTEDAGYILLVECSCKYKSCLNFNIFSWEYIQVVKENGD